jgi:hypothetical protein
MAAALAPQFSAGQHQSTPFSVTLPKVIRKLSPTICRRWKTAALRGRWHQLTPIRITLNIPDVDFMTQLPTLPGAVKTIHRFVPPTIHRDFQMALAGLI